MDNNKSPTIGVKEEDLILAWSVLENITVSLSQIGGAYGHGMDASGNWVDKDAYISMLINLHNYFSKELCEQIGEARIRLGEYISDEEAEELSQHKIPYWNYKSVKRALGD